MPRRWFGHFGSRLGRPALPSRGGQPQSWTEAKVDSENPDRGPLLIVSAEKDHAAPWAIANASYKKRQRNQGVTEIVEVPNRGHALVIDSGWREVSETAPAFVQRFVSPDGTTHAAAPGRAAQEADTTLPTPGPTPSTRRASDAPAHLARPVGAAADAPSEHSRGAAQTGHSSDTCLIASSGRLRLRRITGRQRGRGRRASNQQASCESA
jgi:hypothetical protein